MKRIFRRRGLECIAIIGAMFACGSVSYAQSTASLSEQVNQRNTIGVLSGTPTSGVTQGSTVSFSYQLYTAGAPAPTTDTVQFLDGGTQIGSSVAITMISATNLLPYSQVNTGNGWTTSGTAPTVTPNAVTGPDGSSTSATTVAFPSTTSGTSSVTYAVPSSTSYASQSMTFSVWVQASSTSNLTLALSDSPHVAASQTGSCTAGATWQRCTLTYVFPAGSGTGFAVSITSSGVPAQTVNFWGAQVEQAAQAGAYVSTIGTARPTGAQAGSASLSYSSFLPGSHSITVSFPGDTNYVSSTSNAVAFTVAKATATATVTDSPSGTSVYGQSVTLTASVSGSGVTPTGTVQFMDGATLLGTGTLSAGSASLTLTGSSSLIAGTHTITVVYSGDTNFNTATSSSISHVVTQAPASSLTLTFTSSLNPSVYGDQLTFKLVVSSPVGVTPTGTVTFTDGATTLGTATLDGTGAASLSVSALTAGTHTIHATYGGDVNYQ